MQSQKIKNINIQNFHGSSSYYNRGLYISLVVGELSFARAQVRKLNLSWCVIIKRQRMHPQFLFYFKPIANVRYALITFWAHKKKCFANICSCFVFRANFATSFQVHLRDLYKYYLVSRFINTLYFPVRVYLRTCMLNISNEFPVLNYG